MPASQSIPSAAVWDPRFKKVPMGFSPFFSLSAINFIDELLSIVKTDNLFSCPLLYSQVSLLPVKDFTKSDLFQFCDPLCKQQYLLYRLDKLLCHM